MMKIQKNPGTCTLCGVELAPGPMAKHLPECIETYRRECGTEEESRDGYQIVLQSKRAPMYWMHVLVRDDTTLAQLDTFLRDIWLEGRDHRSRFIVGPKVFVSERSPSGSMPGRTQSDMSLPIYEAIDGDEPFEYAYDLEATTELSARVVGARRLLPDQPDTPVRLLARNNPPEIPCECGGQASLLCPDCEGLLCENCAGDHGCRPSAASYPTLSNTPRAIRRV